MELIRLVQKILLRHCKAKEVVERVREGGGRTCEAKGGGAM